MADKIIVEFEALTDKYNKAVKEIIKGNEGVGSSSEKGNKEAQEAFKKTGKEAGNLTNSIKKLGLQLVGAFAIKQIVTNAIKTISQFEDAMAAVSAITGVTGKELDRFRDRVLDISKNSGVSAKEVAKAFQLIGSATPELLESAESLGEVTEQAIILSKAARLDLASASDALTKSLNQFGLEASDAASIVDTLATSQQKGTATIDQLNASLKNAGAIANSAGLDFQQTNVALQALAAGGFTAEQAGTGLASVLLRLSKSTDKEINPTMTDFATVIDNLSKRNLTLADASKLVEQEGAKYLLTLTSQNDVVQKLNGNLVQQGNALSQAETNTDTLSFATQELSTNWSNFILALDDGDGIFSEVIRGSITLVSELVTAFTDLAIGFDEIQRRAEEARISDIVKLEREEVEKLAKSYLDNGIAIDEQDAKLKAVTDTLNSYNELFKNSTDEQRKAIDAQIGALIELSSQIQEGTDGLLKANQKAEEEAKKLTEAQIKALEKKNDEIRKAANLELDLIAEVSEARGKEQEEITDGILKELEEEEKLADKKKELEDEDTKRIFDKLIAENDARDEKNTLDEEEKELQAQRDIIAKNQKIATTIEGAQVVSDILFGLAEDNKANAIAQATVNAFLAAAGVFAQTPGELIIRSLASGIALAQGLATVVKIQNTPTRLAEGTELVTGGQKGKDSVSALLMPGEAVINAKDNDPKLSKAYNTGKIEDYMYMNRVLPALQEQEKSFQESKNRSFAENIANSFSLQMHDANIVTALKKNRKVSRDNTEILVKALQPQYKTSR